MNRIFMDRLMRVVNELKGGEATPPTAGPNATVEPTPPVEPPVVNYPNNDPTDGERKPKEEKESAETETPTQPAETPSQPTDQPAEPPVSETTPPSEPTTEEPLAPTDPVDEPKVDPEPVAPEVPSVPDAPVEPEVVPVPEPEQPPVVTEPDPVPPTVPEVPATEPEVPAEPPKPEKYITESVVEIRRYQRPLQVFPLNSDEDTDKKLSISDEFVDVIYNPAKKVLKLRRLAHHDSSRFNVVTVDRYSDGTAVTRAVGKGIQKDMFSNSPELTVNIQELYDLEKRWSAFSVDGADPSLPKVTTPPQPLEETEDGELVIDHPPEVTQPKPPVNVTDPNKVTTPSEPAVSQPTDTTNTGATTDASTPITGGTKPAQPVTQPPKNTSPPVELEEGDELEI